MNLHDLVDSILAGDLLSARQWVADAQREQMKWDSLPCPSELDGRGLTVAAGVVELLASRAGAQPPAWTAAVGSASEPFVLDPGLEQMPRSFAQAKAAGPEPLRKRNLLALPDFLDVA